MKNCKRIIVVGGNAAGPAAAAKAKRTDPDAEVILFEKSEFISTGTCELPFVLSGTIPDYKKIIFYDTKLFKAEKDVDVFVNHTVEKIDRRKKTITVKDNLNDKQFDYSYDKLILATGSLTKNISVLLPSIKNAFNFKSVTDLLKIQDKLKEMKHKQVCIVGTGYIGLECAEAFSELDYNVILIEKEEKPFPASDKEISYLIAEFLEKKNIIFYGGINSPDFFIEGDEIKYLKIDGKRYNLDLVINAAGINPNNYLALQAKLEIGIHGGLKVDKCLKTSDPNIFAAGDCLEATNFITNRPDYFPIATIAHNTGHIAGSNAAGGNEFFDPVVKNIAVKFFNNFIVQVGLNEKEAALNNFNFFTVISKAKNMVHLIPGSNDVFGKIIVDKNSRRILGASFFGGKEVGGYGCFISSFIKNKISAQNLCNIDFNYTPPLSPLVNLLSLLGRKIKNKFEY